MSHAFEQRYQHVQGENDEHSAHQPDIADNISAYSMSRESVDIARTSQEDDAFHILRKSGDEDDLNDPLDSGPPLQWEEGAKSESKSLGYLFLLTLSIAGWVATLMHEHCSC
jgi:hypothetical protein